MSILSAEKNRLACQFNIETAGFIEQLSEPLRKNFNITFFGFDRIFFDSTMLRLATNAKWSKTFFEKEYYNDPDFSNVSHVPLNGTFKHIITGKPVSKHELEMYHKADIWNCLIIYERYQTHLDIWSFATTKNNHLINALYLNNADVLQHFTHYFCEKAEHLFDIRDKRKLINMGPTPQNESKISPIPFKEFLNDTPVFKYFLKNSDNGTYLSQREMECLAYLAQGKTSKEIARLVNISYRTVECHVENMKKKLNCPNKSALIDIFQQENIVTPKTIAHKCPPRIS